MSKKESIEGETWVLCRTTIQPVLRLEDGMVLAKGSVQEMLDWMKENT